MSILEKYMCVFTCVLEYAPPKQRITLIKCSNDEFSLSSFQNFAKKEKKSKRENWSFISKMETSNEMKS